MTDAALIEQVAKAAYESGFTAGQPHEPWENISPYWHRVFRRQAVAIAEVLLPVETTPQNEPGDYDSDLFGGAA